MFLSTIRQITRCSTRRFKSQHHEPMWRPTQHFDRANRNQLDGRSFVWRCHLTGSRQTRDLITQWPARKWRHWHHRRLVLLLTSRVVKQSSSGYRGKTLTRGSGGREIDVAIWWISCQLHYNDDVIVLLYLIDWSSLVELYCYGKGPRIEYIDAFLRFKFCFNVGPPRQSRQ